MARSRPASLIAVGCVMLALALAACGSTVNQGASTVGGDATGAAGGTVGTSQAGGSSVTGPGTPGEDSQGRLSGGGAPDVVGGVRSASPDTSADLSGDQAGTLANGPGISSKEISLGLIYTRNADAYLAGFGSSGVKQGDERALPRTVINDINRTGGVAGRRLTALYYPFDLTSATSKDSQYQAACDNFTQDHKVFWAWARTGPGSGYVACMTKAGTVLGAATSGFLYSRAQYASYPNLYDVLGLNGERLSVNLVRMLRRLHYFTPWDTVNGGPPVAAAAPVNAGILVPDLPAFHDAVSRALIPSLRAAGVHVGAQDVYYYYWPNTNDEIGRAVSDIQSAVLRFKGDGVTHVLPLEVSGFAFFAQGAERQHYRPRYGLNTFDSPNVYAGSLVPYEQLKGGVGLGYTPLLDQPLQYDSETGPYSNDARRHCLKVMRADGQPVSTTTEQVAALSYCDVLYTFRRVVESIPPGEPITQKTFSAALDRAGSVPASLMFRAYLSPRQRDMATVGWPYVYKDDCTCMRYDSGPSMTLS